MSRHPARRLDFTELHTGLDARVKTGTVTVSRQGDPVRRRPPDQAQGLGVPPRARPGLAGHAARDLRRALRGRRSRSPAPRGPRGVLNRLRHHPRAARRRGRKARRRHRGRGAAPPRAQRQGGRPPPGSAARSPSWLARTSSRAANSRGAGPRSALQALAAPRGPPDRHAHHCFGIHCVTRHGLPLSPTRRSGEDPACPRGPVP